MLFIITLWKCLRSSPWLTEENTVKIRKQSTSFHPLVGFLQPFLIPFTQSIWNVRKCVSRPVSDGRTDEPQRNEPWQPPITVWIALLLLQEKRLSKIISNDLMVPTESFSLLHTRLSLLLIFNAETDEAAGSGGGKCGKNKRYAVLVALPASPRECYH
jgi:hypothetical protein